MPRWPKPPSPNFHRRKTTSHDWTPGGIQFADLRVQRQKIVKDPDPKQSCSEQVDDGGHPLLHVKSVSSKYSEERQQNPCNAIISGAEDKTLRRVPVHAWDEENVDEPANAA